MASPNVYQTGPGGVTGDRLATSEPLYIANGGFVWYVGNTVVGAADAAATGGALDGGRRREKPLKTVAQAVTNAAAGDVIVFLAGHAETLTLAQTVSKSLTFVSEGTGSGRARFTCGGAVAMFDVTASNVKFRNLYFPASTAVPTARVRFSDISNGQVSDCYFECGTNDTTRAVQFVTGAGPTSGRVTGTSFVATSATPATAVEVSGAMVGFDMEDVTFDGGAFGWSSYAFKASAGITAMSFIGINLLSQSDMQINTSSSGYISLGTVSGSSVVRIDA